MATIADVVAATRAQLSGTLGSEVTLLTREYQPGDGVLYISGRNRLAPGQTICVGLTTFTVLDQDAAEVPVAPSIDGSPDEAHDVGSVVLLRPQHTTWQVFSQIADTVDEISSGKHGLYRIEEQEFPVDVVDGTYALETAPIKVLRVRYRRPGSEDDWHDVAWTSQPLAGSQATVRTGPVPGGTVVEIIYAAPFRDIEDLDDDLSELGMPENYRTLLAVGAARNLVLANESRRAQPFSQGDPRRAEEVPSTGNVVVYDRLERRFRDLVATERARLINITPYRYQMEAFR